MIKSMMLSGLLLLFLTSAQALLRSQWRQSVTCHVMYIHVYEKDVDDRVECEVVAGGTIGHSYTIELPSTLLNENQELLMKGEWYVDIPGAKVEEVLVDGYGMIGSSLSIPDPSKIKTIPPPTASGTGRNLATTGQRTLMVARVSVSDATPTYTASQLQPWYFDPNSFSVARQYSRCSSGQQVFVPWSTPVLDVFVSGSISSFSQTTLVNAAISEVQIALGGTSLPVQHIAFVLPPGGPTFIAVGQVKGWRSTYYDTFGGIPDTAMHELGHNLGLGHAGIPGDQYGDMTSLMGYGELAQFAPSKCFNACDHINFGWFTDRTVLVDPTQGPQTITLATFVDYSLTSSSQPVVLQIGGYCLSYNRAKGVNFQTEEAYNQVTVSHAEPGNMSTRFGEIDETTPPYTEANYNGGFQQLVIQVCNRANAGGVDYATVAVGLGSVNCGATASAVASSPPPPPTPSPVTPPTPSPIPPPTPSPIPPPTPSPIPPPTPSPIPPPTPSPIPPPTPSPMPPPTPSPIQPQTPSPTASTPSPSVSTSVPTSSPLPPPSPLPTLRPTQKPFKPPTRKPSQKPVASTVVPATGPFAVFINAGSNSAYTAKNGVTWSADKFFIGGTTMQQPRASVADTSDAALYLTQRVGQVQYNIPVPKINNYQVTLLFAEIDPNAQAKGSRVFDIYFQGALAYNNFDIFNAAGGGFKAVSLAPVIAVVGGTLQISFVSQVNLPLIAAIEVAPY